MCTISLSLAKPGEAMPGPSRGPYSSLMVLAASPACVPELCRTGGPGEKTQDNADTTLIRVLTSDKECGTCRAVARAAFASEKGSVRRVHAGIVCPLSNLGNHSPPAQ